MNDEGRKCGKILQGDEELVTSFLEAAGSRHVIARCIGKRRSEWGKCVGKLSFMYNVYKHIYFLAKQSNCLA